MCNPAEIAGENRGPTSGVGDGFDLTIEYTKEDCKIAHRYRKQGKYLWLVMVFGCIALPIAFSGQHYFFSEKSFTEFLLFVWPIPFLLGAVFFGLIQYDLYMERRRYQKLILRIMLGDKCLRFERDGRSVSMSVLHDFLHKPDACVLYFSDGRHQIIPRRVIDSDADWERLGAMVERLVNKDRDSIPPSDYDIDLQFAYCYNDKKLAILANIRRRMTPRVVLVLAITLLLLLILGIYDWYYPFIIIVFIPGLCLFATAPLLFKDWLVSKLKKGADALSDWTHLCLNRKELVVASKEGTFTFEQLHFVYVEKKICLLGLDKINCIGIPRRVVDSDAEWDNLIETARALVKDK